MKRLVLLLISVFVVMNGVFAQEVEIEFLDDCLFPVPLGEIIGETMDCGMLLVPQDRNEPDGLWLEIAFAVLYATNPDPEPDPIVYLEGGPGGSALSAIDYWATFYMRQNRDIIIFDQRGAGYSYPRLVCDDIDEDNTDMQALADCRAQFEADGVDLADFNTINNANDVSDLMVTLGYPEWNLFGVSYGTRLALNIMRDFPDGIRSVIIDAVYPPVVNAYEELPMNGYRSFQQLFADCLADSACNTAFPNLETRLYALIDRLNATPIILADESELTGDGLADALFNFFYDTTIIPYLPLMIDELDNGGQTILNALNDGILPISDEDTAYDPAMYLAEAMLWELDEFDDDIYYAFYDDLDAWDETRDGLGFIIESYFDDVDTLFGLLDELPDDQFSRLYAMLYAEDVSDSTGMYDAFECFEEIPFNSVEQEALLSADLPPQFASFIAMQAQVDSCLVWQSGIPPQSETEAVYSDIPTLVLSGSYDPITPPAWGLVAAQTLSNSTAIEFPAIGHGAVDSADCPSAIALAFIENPTAPIDTSCVATMRVQFVTEMPDLSEFEE